MQYTHFDFPHMTHDWKLVCLKILLLCSTGSGKSGCTVLWQLNRSVPLVRAGGNQSCAHRNQNMDYLRLYMCCNSLDKVQGWLYANLDSLLFYFDSSALILASSTVSHGNLDMAQDS